LQPFPPVALAPRWISPKGASRHHERTEIGSIARFIYPEITDEVLTGGKDSVGDAIFDGCSLLSTGQENRSLFDTRVARLALLRVERIILAPCVDVEHGREAVDVWAGEAGTTPVNKVDPPKEQRR
jgi:hypothetical protein